MSLGATPLTLPHWFVSTARHRGDLPAVTDPIETLTYEQLLERAAGAARALRARGLVRGRPVAFLLTPSANYVAQIYGCLLAGGVPAPVNTRLAPPEARGYLERIDPCLVVHDDAFANLVDAAAVSSVTTLHVDALRGDADVQQPTVASMLDELREEDPAIIFATGGTTGLPKGAYTDHRGLQLWVWNVAANSRRHQNEVELFFSPFFHVSLVVGGFAPLFVGGHMVIQPSFEAAAAIELMRRHGVTRLMGAPTLFTAVANHPDADADVRGRIRDIVFGSTAASEAWVAKLLHDFPNAQIGTGYGATELASGVSRASDADLRAGRIGGVGRPNVGCEIRIIDMDGNDLPVGATGEVIVRSPWQTRGYWNQPEETASTYRADGFINLGDLGRFDETGWLWIVGRTKEMIITGGENVFPVEVEAELSQLPGVSEVVVFGVADEYWGDRIEAVVTARAGAALDADSLRVALRDRLAGYKVPKRIHVVDAIPVTANNKPDRRTLSLRYADPQT